MRYSTELYALTLIAGATALMWVPYVIARLSTRGLGAIANRDSFVPPDPLWADRARRAHANAIENLAVFAPLVLVGAVTGVSTATTAFAAWVYVGARLVHYVAFVAGVPFMRTPAFLVGACATVTIAVVLLGHRA